MSDHSSDDEDSDIDEGHACRDSYPPGLSDNDDAQFMWIECDQCHYWYHYLCENIDSQDEIESSSAGNAKKLNKCNFLNII